MKLPLNLKNVIVGHRPIRREAVTIRLPMPPSVNHLFANAPGRGRIPTAHYVAWQIDAGKAVIQAGRPRVNGAVEISITLDDTGTRMDLDNGAKATLDLLVSMRVIDGDKKSIVRKLILAWGTEKGAIIRIIPSPYLARSAAA